MTAENICTEVLAVMQAPEKEKAVRERLLKIKSTLGGPEVMKSMAKRIGDVMAKLGTNEKNPI
jgi:hypothetical protein